MKLFAFIANHPRPSGHSMVEFSFNGILISLDQPSLSDWKQLDAQLTRMMMSLIQTRSSDKTDSNWWYDKVLEIINEGYGQMHNLKFTCC